MLNDQSLLENLLGHTGYKDTSSLGTDPSLSLRDRVRMAKDMHQTSYPFGSGMYNLFVSYKSTPSLPFKKKYGQG